jgi:hypothetical protein
MESIEKVESRIYPTVAAKGVGVDLSKETRS